MSWTLLTPTTTCPWEQRSTAHLEGSVFGGEMVLVRVVQTEPFVVLHDPAREMAAVVFVVTWGQRDPSLLASVSAALALAVP